MQSNDKIGFITDKIKHLETALLHMHSESVLQLPSTVVQTLLIDDNGYVWFSINKPSQQINQFDKRFYVGLNFYRKGTPFFLNTYGLACLVADPEELVDLSPVLLKEIVNDKVLIRVKILNATYYEHETELSNTWYHKCRHFIKSMLAHDDNYYILNFDKEPYLS